MNYCKPLLILAVTAVVLLTSALARIENQRYAMSIGMCKIDGVGYDQTCLDKVQTRTSWVWHVFYALTN